MRITAVKTFLLEHPLARPAGPATYYYRTRQTLFIKVESDAGICGWGETAAFTGVNANRINVACSATGRSSSVNCLSTFRTVTVRRAGSTPFKT